MSKIKNLIHSSNKPIEQLKNRLMEIFHCENISKDENEIEITQSKIKYNNYNYDLSEKNRYILLNNRKNLKICSFDNRKVVGKIYNDLKNLYELPVKSCYLNIYCSNDICTDYETDIFHFDRKLFCIPFDSHYKMGVK